MTVKKRTTATQVRELKRALRDMWSVLESCTEGAETWSPRAEEIFKRSRRLLREAVLTDGYQSKKGEEES